MILFILVDSFFFLDRVSQLMISISDDYTFYLQTKILISIWCRRELNLRFLMINSLLINTIWILIWSFFFFFVVSVVVVVYTPVPLV